jgi:hypothetical protein
MTLIWQQHENEGHYEHKPEDVTGSHNDIPFDNIVKWITADVGNSMLDAAKPIDIKGVTELNDPPQPNWETLPVCFI